MTSDDVLIKHILGEIDFLLKNTEQKSLEEFTQDEVLKRAAARSMHDAAKMISTEFKENCKTIDWKAIAGMRDKVVHHYFGVSWNILWNVIRTKLPEIKTHLESLPDSKNET